MDGNSNTEARYTVGHPFCGMGLGAKGFQDAESRLFGQTARFKCVGGIDLDAKACAMFERLTKSPALVADVATLTPEALRKFWPTAPDVIFTSPPCKGYSQLTSKKARTSKKYQDMNRLALDWVKVMLATWPDAPPRLMLLENVPGIATLGKDLLREIRKLLRAAGYVVSPDQSHDCGEIGNLAQRRMRFLLVARHAKRVPALLYQPRKRPLRAVGEVLEKLPLPGDPSMGPLHQLPKISTLNWWRLALIPPGGDWRDIPGTVVKGKKRREVFRRYHLTAWSETSPTVASMGTNAPNYVADVRLDAGRYGMNMRVGAWSSPAWCVTGATDVQAGAPSIADPRVGSAQAQTYGVVGWESSIGTVTGRASTTTGAFSVADPRVPKAFRESYGVLCWEDTAGTVKGESWVSAGRFCIADPRLTCRARNGAYGVIDWTSPAFTLTGSGQIDNSAVAVSDPRVPGCAELVVRWYPHRKHLRRSAPFPLVIPSADGTWHRPLTTLEILRLQGGPTHLDGKPLARWASDSKMREHIGNGVPVDAARAIAGQMLNTLLGADMECGILMGGGGAVWVRDREVMGHA